MLAEFKKFALRGNVMDMAIGIIIGAAFGTIVKSLVDDVMMPPIGMLTGGVDFSDKYLLLEAGANAVDGAYTSLDAAVKDGAVTLRWGNFVNQVISFVIVAFSVFLLVKGMNNLKGKEPEPEPTEKKCGFCATTIPLAATRCPHCTSELTA